MISSHLAVAEFHLQMISREIAPITEYSRHCLLFSVWRSFCLILVFITPSTSVFTGIFSFHTTWSPLAKWRGHREIDVLLGIDTDQERGDITDLLTNTDVTLTDQHTSVMHGPSNLQLEHLRLQTTFHEFSEGQSKHVIQFAFVLVQKTKT